MSIICLMMKEEGRSGSCVFVSGNKTLQDDSIEICILFSNNNDNSIRIVIFP